MYLYMEEQELNQNINMNQPEPVMENMESNHHGRKKILLAVFILIAVGFIAFFILNRGDGLTEQERINKKLREYVMSFSSDVTNDPEKDRQLKQYVEEFSSPDEETEITEEQIQKNKRLTDDISEGQE